MFDGGAGSARSSSSVLGAVAEGLRMVLRTVGAAAAAAVLRVGADELSACMGGFRRAVRRVAAAVGALWTGGCTLGRPCFSAAAGGSATFAAGCSKIAFRSETIFDTGDFAGA
jgi:hypothetical protein